MKTTPDQIKVDDEGRICHVYALEGGGTCETWPHAASGAELAKPLLLPDVETFAGVFEGFAFHDEQPTGPKLVSFRPSHRYGKATTTPAVDEAVQRHMLDLGIRGFEVIDHDNGWCLVACYYASILGSRFVAYVRRGTLPAGAL